MYPVTLTGICTCKALADALMLTWVINYPVQAFFRQLACLKILIVGQQLLHYNKQTNPRKNMENFGYVSLMAHSESFLVKAS